MHSLRTGLALSLVVVTTVRADEISFNRDVRPLLSDRCFACHGPDAAHREADLRLDVEEVAKELAIVPGKPDESELVARITSNDPDVRMPPGEHGKALSAEEIDLLKRWIAEGAKYEPFWAYVPPKRHAVPQPKDAKWSSRWIDRFVLDRLEQEGLEPSPDADRVTLLRRVSFDLTGLPPTPAEVDAFLADVEPGAYERVVDRLLASPRYGERMAMYWLDLVRYADTVGYHGDQDHEASPYRDYVIDAFHRNLPFDRFTREQLAGDLVEPSGTWQKVASGYNRLLQTSHEGGVQPKEYRAIYAADRVRNVSAVWMGATMGCCQCHDHKFDPYSTKDFYAMSAFFADVDDEQHFKVGSNALPTRRPPEIDVPTAEQQKRLDEIAAELKTKDLPDEKRKALEKERGGLVKSIRKCMVTVALETPRTVRVLPRGNWLDETGPVVQPAIPEFLGTLDVDGRANRLDLANWLVDPKGAGPLTARVMANRFWYLAFGNGLAGDLDDLGGQGEPPTHPKLLDNLAVEFIESGWDVKHMMRLLVTSRAYRQSSVASPELLKRDPQNRLYARQSRFRLPAEMVRDNALSVSGLLVEEEGGESVKPYQPAGYYRHLNFPTRTYKADANENQWRRGVYVHWQRQFLHPMLKAFDAPSREECTAQRPRSNTPLAALVLLNDPTFVEAARHLAERTLREAEKSTDDRLHVVYRHVLSREPDEVEIRLCKELLTEAQAEFADDPEAATKLLDVGLSKRDPSIDAGELAAWTTLCRGVLNTSEAVTRN